MRRYRISTDKVRKRLDGSFIYSLDDGDMTIACRDREVAIFQNGNAVRSDLISRCELFNRLATIPAPPEANDFKAEIYKVIQSMEAK